MDEPLLALSYLLAGDYIDNAETQLKKPFAMTGMLQADRCISSLGRCLCKCDDYQFVCMARVQRTAEVSVIQGLVTPRRTLVVLLGLGRDSHIRAYARYASSHINREDVHEASIV